MMASWSTVVQQPPSLPREGRVGVPSPPAADVFSLSCQCVHQDWPCPPLTAPRSDSRDLLHCLTSTIDRLLSSLFGSCSRHQVQISISRFSTSLNQQKLHNEKKDYKSTKFTKIKSGQQKYLLNQYAAYQALYLFSIFNKFRNNTTIT